MMGGGEGEEKYGIRIGIKMRKGSGARKTNYTDEVWKKFDILISHSKSVNHGVKTLIT